MFQLLFCIVSVHSQGWKGTAQPWTNVMLSTMFFFRTARVGHSHNKQRPPNLDHTSYFFPRLTLVPNWVTASIQELNTPILQMDVCLGGSILGAVTNLVCGPSKTTASLDPLQSWGDIHLRGKL